MNSWIANYWAMRFIKGLRDEGVVVKSYKNGLIVETSAATALAKNGKLDPSWCEYVWSWEPIQWGLPNWNSGYLGAGKLIRALELIGNSVSNKQMLLDWATLDGIKMDWIPSYIPKRLKKRMRKEEMKVSLAEKFLFPLFKPCKDHNIASPQHWASKHGIPEPQTNIENYFSRKRIDKKNFV